MRTLKKQRKREAKQKKKRDAEAAAEASEQQERRRLWESVPQLFTGSDDATGELVDIPSGLDRRRSAISRREIPPAAQKMQMVAEADAVARCVEENFFENATALAITMSLAEGGDSANGTAGGSGT